MPKHHKKETQELAKTLFMKGVPQKEISLRLHISERTISAWALAEHWKEKRAATTITRTELISKALGKINDLLESDNQDGIGDKLIKIANSIEKLDKNANVVDFMQTFLAFTDWAMQRMAYDPELTPELLKHLTKYHDLFINQHFNQ